MKIQVIYGAIAMAMGVFGALGDDASPSDETIFAALAQPPVHPAPAAATFTEALPALAYMPADTEAYLAFAHIGQHLERIVSGGMLLDQPIGRLPEELSALQSFAVSLDSGSSAVVQPLINLMFHAWYDSELRDWQASADSAAADLIAQQIKRNEADISTALARLHRSGDTSALRPTYAVLTLREGHEHLAEQWGKLLVSRLLACGAGEAESVQCGDFYGVKCPSAWAPASSGNFYVMLRHSGSALIVVLCSDPQHIRQPDSAEQSLLAAPHPAACDSAAQDLFFVNYISKNLVSAADSALRSSLAEVTAATQSIYSAMAVADPAHKQEFNRAAAGIGLLLDQAMLLCGPSAGQDSVAVCRLNAKELSLEFSTDARGSSYEPGTLRYVAQSSEPNTIFYAESTPSAGIPATPTLSQILPALCDSLRGLALTLQPADPARRNMIDTMDEVTRITPALSRLGHAFSTVGQALGKGSAFLIDADGSLPSLFGGTRNNRVAIPRLAYCAPVAHRSYLAQGWEEILRASGELVSHFGGSPLLPHALPFLSERSGAATSYSLFMPVFTEHLVPNATVSDSVFIAGTSSAFNKKLAASATGTMPYQGCVFALHLKTLATTLRGIADAYRSRIPADEEALPMSQFDETSAPLSADSLMEPSDLEKVSEILEQCAVTAELAASVAQSLYGSITITDNRLTLRSRIFLQPSH